MVRILHFADAHIDMISFGKHDPVSGLPVRVMDFLKSLDTIVDTAIQERVDLVLFAGDAYKDRNPAPTYQREWGRRIMRLSQAGIPTLLLVGNHDVSPALGRAHALEVFNTLQVPHVRVIDRPIFLAPEMLEGLPLQVLAIPWVSRSGVMAYFNLTSVDPEQVYAMLEARLQELVHTWLEEADPALPIVLTAHGSVMGASYGNERTVMLGGDLIYSGALVKNPRLDYVALGHIHKAQNLNENGHPPVVYPGSIERVDFGEAKEEKFFVIAEVERGRTKVEWRRLAVRPVVDAFLRLKGAAPPENLAQRLRAALPEPGQLEDAIVRLTVEYPHEWDVLIDEQALRAVAASAFDFRLVKRPISEARIRLPEDQTLSSLSALELLDIYWRANHVDEEERKELARLAAQVIAPPES